MIKRYEVYPESGYTREVEDPTGEWVKFQDIEEFFGLKKEESVDPVSVFNMYYAEGREDYR